MNYQQLRNKIKNYLNKIKKIKNIWKNYKKKKFYMNYKLKLINC